jgi:hypothetical protein
MSPIPLTHTLAQDQKRAMSQAQAMAQTENHGATTLVTQDRGREPDYFIYVYNILGKEWIVRQPPLFPSFHIPACEKGKKFSYTILPPYVNEVLNKAGTTELSYKQIDGRKAATSLLNPGAFPGTKWESQLHDWDTDDQTGNNLNNFGCFWSLTTPTELDKLEVEIGYFKERLRRTMEELVKRAEELHDSGERKLISPMMHFAMDYLGKQSAWHTSLKHMVSCPVCGDTIQEGIAYHRNAFGEKCIIDMDRYMKSVVQTRPAVQVASEEDPDEEVPVAPAPRKKSAVKKA